MTKPLEGRVAAVTGASSGIGEATAIALAGAGASVALGARREDRLRDLTQRIEQDGGRALPLALDASDEDSAREFAQAAHRELGGLDLLVNNAGVMLLGPVEGADPEHWRRMVDVNVLGVLYCTHAVLPIMRESGGGHVVIVSSVAGRYAHAGSAAYNFTKFGATGFAEALRQEGVGANVRVTVVEPGFVDTELQGHNEHPAVREAIDRMRADIGDVLRAEDIAAAILYAVSQPPHVSVNEILIRPTGQRR